MYGAIEFNGGNFQYMESLGYSITLKSIKALKAAKVPEDVLESLKPLKNEKYKTEASFKAALKEALDINTFNQYHTLILTHTEAAGRFEGNGYVEFLKQLLQRFEGKKIILVEDGARYHDGKVVKEFIKENAAHING